MFIELQLTRCNGRPTVWLTSIPTLEDQPLVYSVDTGDSFLEDKEVGT